MKELHDICTPASACEAMLRLACVVHIQLTAWSAAASAAALSAAPKERRCADIAMSGIRF
eukprot:3239645-Pyramimonas_sp.AAC.1